jgi:hypothetical protein
MNMSKRAPRVLALLAGAGWCLAQVAAGQYAERSARSPIVVDRADTASPTSGPILVVDGPQSGQTVGGAVAITGWALAPNGIDKIELFLDGSDVPTNRAVLNLPRPGVLAAFPSFNTPQNARPGFVTSFLARNFTDGPHQFTLALTESGVGTTTFGPFDVVVNNAINQAPFGSLDIPSNGVTVGENGSVAVVGWALDDSDIDHVDFFIDGHLWASAIGRGGVGNATFGATRPDVFAAFPDFPGPQPKSLFSGYLAILDTTQVVNGLHVISVRATDDQGSAREIGAATVQVENVGALLGPFGVLEYPLDEATLICGPAVPITPPTGPCPSPCFPGSGGGGTPVSSFPNIVKGWALDVGVRQDRGQVSWVELLIDGQIVANTRTDCVVSAGGAVFANCYGLNRPDIGQRYQGFVNSANSGFQFTFALARDPFLGLLDVLVPTPLGVLEGFTVPGKHTLSVRAGDEEETLAEFAPISVDITCDTTSSNPDRASFGDVDTPGEDQFVQNLINIQGWAFDLDGGIGSVDLAIDGTIVATLTCPSGTYCIRRDDVPAKDRRVTTPFVGFSFLFDTHSLGDSQHDLTVYANQGGHHTLIGRRQFVVFNNSATKP